ncbi:hypothetical protein HYPSUDRAFT_142938 [Hypholoma sublateritium FD-334 SS-4]|uniref:DUF3533 domain-containing protein n=1 Tax=Hypholoma sublateritium (strain FD-334 SS-4) TaxID=945553 RepID=A0A0D2M997_HYPSF|nr:hypothetical protein HYPSUDRAFT_142938 [Hypholoma sublateritium FD-334 SS-4]
MNSLQIGSDVKQETSLAASTLPLASLSAERAPFSYHFFGNEKEIAKARIVFIKIMFQRTMLVVAAILAVFSIFWAAMQKQPARTLEGWIVDFDGGVAGQFVVQELSAMSDAKIRWTERDAAINFPAGPPDLVQAVMDERCWIAVAINPGVTQSLNGSLTLSTQPFNSSTAITAYAVEGRNENIYRTLFHPVITNALDKITHDYAVKHIGSVIASNTPLTDISPDLLTRPVYFTFDNLRPFDVPVASTVTYIGLIYLLILSFIVVNAGIMARAVSGLDKKLTTASLIRVRLISPVICYIPLTLAYSLLTLAFGLPFDRYLGKAGFMIFWMLSWFGMAAAGLVLESMMTLLTIKYINVFMILWIISNVSVSVWPIEALPIVYRYGYAAPFYNISQGVRAIAFGAKNNLLLNFGVLSGWVLVSFISLPIVQWFRRREEVEAAKRVVLPESSV